MSFNDRPGLQHVRTRQAIRDLQQFDCPIPTPVAEALAELDALTARAPRKPDDAALAAAAAAGDDTELARLATEVVTLDVRAQAHGAAVENAAHHVSGVLAEHGAEVLPRLDEVAAEAAAVIREAQRHRGRSIEALVRAGKPEAATAVASAAAARQTFQRVAELADRHLHRALTTPWPADAETVGE
ncbi:hypothetical protein MTER_24540 [Mycolicibacter terrae]|uniref:Uncharacterized protein n=1 Tax=Mycolicibacter terrae TaxID=1788 RepID=A0AAD1HYH2_9MYCO|nr:hypothetical protein [Mycolicibacter terrae]ORW92430.1 hypothetical protein AWC28_00825 [Mycolicibacter terrae]BBX23043.1 hypothetical protein MTER_24540 [Mycolicibacter terrae]SNV68642.1 Uncharacterised protein [Mycolicibacter terrae]